MKHLRTAYIASLALLIAIPSFGYAQAGNTILENPLKFDSIGEFVEAILEAVVMIALPLIALAVVYAGFQYITAQGNQNKIKSAHQIFLNTIIGAILILGAWTLATIISSTINELRG